MEGEKIVINDNELLNNDINEHWKKAGQCVNDVGGTITRTEEIIETASFEIKFRLISKHKKKECQFNIDPMTCLTKECDDKARKVLEEKNYQHEDKNMDKVGNQCAMLNDEILDRHVRDAVRKWTQWKVRMVICVRRVLRITIS